MPKSKFTAVVDTREKRDVLLFPEDKYCTGTKRKALKTGDISIEGLEDIFVIERKRTTAEISMNAFEDRFKRELERLQQFKYKFILCQFDANTILNFPKGSGIPPRFWDSVCVSGSYLLARIMYIQINYKIPVILAGTEGFKVAFAIMKQVARNEGLV